ncbi:MAG: hypothetical protein QW292_11215 [Candidatus Parvarchaeota archaeon]
MVDDICEMIAHEPVEMMQNLEEDYSYRKFFFNGDMFAIISEPKENYVLIENQITIMRDLFRK